MTAIHLSKSDDAHRQTREATQNCGRIWIICTILLLAHSGVAVGQPEPDSLLPDEEFVEYLQARVPVGSKGLVHGFDALAEGGKVDPESWFVAIPKGCSSPLVLDLSSSDGRYSARFTYRWDGEATGRLVRLRLPEPLDHDARKALEDLRASELGVLAQVGAQTVVPVRPSVGTAQTDSFRILVNSDYEINKLWWTGKEDYSLGVCRRLRPGVVARAFNLTCPLPDPANFRGLRLVRKQAGVGPIESSDILVDCNASQ